MEAFDNSTLLLILFRVFFITILVDAVHYCAANPSDIIPKPDNCAQYYNCSEKSTDLGEHLKECKYPDLFSGATRTCQTFTNVSCEKRLEPQAPCKY